MNASFFDSDSDGDNGPPYKRSAASRDPDYLPAGSAQGHRGPDIEPVDDRDDDNESTSHSRFGRARTAPPPQNTPYIEFGRDDVGEAFEEQWGRGHGYGERGGGDGGEDRRPKGPTMGTLPDDWWRMDRIRNNLSMTEDGRQRVGFPQWYAIRHHYGNEEPPSEAECNSCRLLSNAEVPQAVYNALADMMMQIWNENPRLVQFCELFSTKMNEVADRSGVPHLRVSPLVFINCLLFHPQTSKMKRIRHLVTLTWSSEIIIKHSACVRHMDGTLECPSDTIKDLQRITVTDIGLSTTRKYEDAPNGTNNSTTPLPPAKRVTYIPRSGPMGRILGH